MILKFKNNPYYNCQVEYINGDCVNIAAIDLHMNNLDYWHDWWCAAGRDRIYVDDQLNIWSGECKNDQLGSALNDELKLLENGTICQRNRCSYCDDDLMVSKNKR